MCIVSKPRSGLAVPDPSCEEPSHFTVDNITHVYSCWIRFDNWMWWIVRSCYGKIKLEIFLFLGDYKKAVLHEIKYMH